MKYIILMLVAIVMILVTTQACDTRQSLKISQLKCSKQFGFQTDRMVFANITGDPNSEVIIKNPAGYVLIEASTDSLGAFNSQFLLDVTNNTVIINDDIVELVNNSINYEIKTPTSQKVVQSSFAHRHFPYEGGWSTIMFEDQWPKNGDYDMNDLIVDFYIKQTYNIRTKKIAQIDIKYKIRAIGAMYRVGFGFLLPAERIPGGLARLEYSNGHGQEVWLNNRKELRLFINAKEVLNIPPNKFLNTTHSSQGVHMTPQLYQMSLVYTSVDWSSQEYQQYTPTHRWQVAPYNPLMYVSRFDEPLDSGRRVHLKNYPIDKSRTNSNLFMTENDRSTEYNNINRLVTYQNSNGMPWAIYTNVRIPYYPIQKVDILRAFPNFQSWVTSNGLQHVEWYLSSINMDLVY